MSPARNIGKSYPVPSTPCPPTPVQQPLSISQMRITPSALNQLFQIPDVPCPPPPVPHRKHIHIIFPNQPKPPEPSEDDLSEIGQDEVRVEVDARELPSDSHKSRFWELIDRIIHLVQKLGVWLTSFLPSCGNQKTEDQSESQPHHFSVHTLSDAVNDPDMEPSVPDQQPLPDNSIIVEKQAEASEKPASDPALDAHKPQAVALRELPPLPSIPPLSTKEQKTIDTFISEVEVFLDLIDKNAWTIRIAAQGTSLATSLLSIRQMNKLSVCEYLISSNPEKRARIRNILRNESVRDEAELKIAEQIAALTPEERPAVLKLYTDYAHHKAETFRLQRGTIDMLIQNNAYLELAMLFIDRFPR